MLIMSLCLFSHTGMRQSAVHRRIESHQWPYPFIKNTRIIARNHYSQIPARKVLYPGVKSTQNGPSWAISDY